MMTKKKTKKLTQNQKKQTLELASKFLCAAISTAPSHLEKDGKFHTYFPPIEISVLRCIEYAVHLLNQIEKL